MIDHKLLKKIAKERVKQKIVTEDQLEDFLSIWWSRKYNLPSNHHLFLDRTMEEHMLDFYTHQLLDAPEADDDSATTVEELEELDEWYKEELGDEYSDEYDYFIDPIEAQGKSEAQLNRMVLEGAKSMELEEGSMGASVKPKQTVLEDDEIDEDFTNG